MTVRASAIFALLASTVAAAEPTQPAQPSQQMTPAGGEASQPPQASPANDTTAAPGQPRPAELPAADKEWVLRLDARAWYVAPAGDLTLPSTGPAGVAVDLGTLDVDAPRISPYGEVHIQADKFLFSISGAHQSIDRNSTATSTFRVGDVQADPGDTLNTDVDWSLVQASMGYRIWERKFDDRGDSRLRLWALGGVRIEDLSFTVSEVGVNQTSADEFFFHPYVGVRAEAVVARQFSVDLELSAGYWPGDSSAFSMDVAAALSWRPVSWVGVQAGYRLLITDTETGDGAARYRFDGSLAGLFAGVTFRF